MSPSRHTIKFTPEFLGPLSEEPWNTEYSLFNQEEHFYNARKLEKLTTHFEELTPKLMKTLYRGEFILHAMPATYGDLNCLLSTLFSFGLFPLLNMRFSAGTLVFTNSRALFVFHHPKFRHEGWCYISFPYSGLKKVVNHGTIKLRFKNGWLSENSFFVGWSHRKILKLIIPRINEKLINDQSTKLPKRVLHCRECKQISRKSVRECSKCGVTFMTPWQAALRSLVVPGGGFFRMRLPRHGMVAAVLEVAMLAAVAGAGYRFMDQLAIVIATGSILVLLIKGLNMFAAAKSTRWAIPQNSGGTASAVHQLMNQAERAKKVHLAS